MTRKKTIFGILLLVLVVTLLVVIFYIQRERRKYEMPRDVYIILNNQTFEVFQEYTSDDLIQDSNVQIISKGEKLSTDNVGMKRYTLDYKYNGKLYKYVVNYQVKDISKPIFIRASSIITVAIDDDIKEPCEKIVYADDTDNNPSCMVNGWYDTNKIGEYNNLEFVIRDKSGNEVKKKFSFRVVDKIKGDTSTSQPNYKYISDVIDEYKSDKTSIGIDVSMWQGDVEFEKVRNSGIEFVMMRIAYQKNPEDKIVIDPRFKEYFKAAKEAGLKVGVYVYNVALSKRDGEKVARYVLDILDGEVLDLPIAYDWENWDQFMDYKISLHTLSDGYLAFEDEIKKNGYDAMLYGSKFYLENVWLGIDNSKVWLAHYTDKTDYMGNYLMWQVTSLGKVDGITDNTVDIDILYK